MHSEMGFCSYFGCGGGSEIDRRKGKPFATYAIGTGENMPLRNSIDLISSLINKDIPIKFGAVPYKNGQIAHSAIDIGRLVSDTGYTPKYNFTKGITEVIDFYRKK